MSEERKTKRYERINLMITVVRRSFAEKVIKDLRDMGITYNMATVGGSLGGLVLADYLGFADTELDIILSVVSESKVEKAMALIEYGYSENPDGGAIAALVPIEGVSGPLVLEYISGPAAAEDE